MTPSQELVKNALANARSIVIKIGSSLLAGPQGADGLCLATMARGLAPHLNRGGSLTLVSSGAVALGREIAPSLGSSVADKQALSAIGQRVLIARWQSAFSKIDRTVAQVLLTPDITDHRPRYLNARRTLRLLTGNGYVPIVNENDAVASKEIRYGDNDRLAVTTAGMIEADLVILLTDIDGLYTANPKSNDSAEHMPVVSASDLEDMDHADMTTGSSVGTGGMASKVDAAHLAASWGISSIIASGSHPDPLDCLRTGTKHATFIQPSEDLTNARRRWLSSVITTTREVIVDQGAADALADGQSLLYVGVVSMTPDIQEGETISIMSNSGETIGYGIAKAGAAALRAEEEKIVIHRDDIVLEQTQ